MAKFPVKAATQSMNNSSRYFANTQKLQAFLRLIRVFQWQNASNHLTMKNHVKVMNTRFSCHSSSHNDFQVEVVTDTI